MRMGREANFGENSGHPSYSRFHPPDGPEGASIVVWVEGGNSVRRISSPLLFHFPDIRSRLFFPTFLQSQKSRRRRLHYLKGEREKV